MLPCPAFLRALLVAVLAFGFGSGFTLAQTESARGGQPTKFQWEYKGEEEPGARYWSRQGETWTERYPSGYSKTFRVLRTATVQFDDGSFQATLHGAILEIATQNGRPVRGENLTLFVPDLGEEPWLLCRSGQKWVFIGRMEKIE